MATDAPQYEETYFGDKRYVEMTGRFGLKVKPLYSKGNGMNREYYTLGNIGWWLSIQREQAGVTRTAVAQAMMYPGGAIKNIEEGRRIPKAATVQKYLDAVYFLSDKKTSASSHMYRKLHS